MIEQRSAEAFLSSGRLALVGASANPRSFGNTIYRALKTAGIPTVAVNLTTSTVEGDTSYPTLAAVPGHLDGVIVMVGPDRSPAAVRDVAARGVPRVWLFQGLGGPGAATPEAISVATSLGLEVIAGACPLMFLEPVGWFHRLHRGARRLNRSLVDTAAP
jgi:hypothetical protein